MMRRRAANTPAEASATPPLLSILEMENKIADRHHLLEQSEQRVVDARATADQVMEAARRQAAEAAAECRRRRLEQADADAERLRSDAAEQAERIRRVAAERRAADVAEVLAQLLPSSRTERS